MHLSHSHRIYHSQNMANIHNSFNNPGPMGALRASALKLNHVILEYIVISETSKANQTGLNILIDKYVWF